MSTSKMGRPAITSILLLLCVMALVKSNPTGDSNQLDVAPYLADSGVPSSDFINRDLLAQLLSAPSQDYNGRSKRQWCPRGMAYNYVLGSCKMSLAALRQRGRV